MGYEDDILVHYGTPRHSGRYPWGSGKNPQRSRDFLQRVRDMKKTMSETEVASALGMNTTQLRAKISSEKQNLMKQNMAMAYRLRDKGVSLSEISRRLGVPVTTVSSYFDESRKRADQVEQSVADVLKEQLKDKPYLNTTKGANLYLGISETKLKNALANLKEEGYSVNEVDIEQLGVAGTQYTKLRILSPPGTSRKDAYEHRFDIQPVDGVIFKGNGFDGVTRAGGPPAQLDGKRVAIRYSDDPGLIKGSDKDGIIEIRRGVADLDLGDAHYAQVRIAIDGKYYAKGMAVYSDDLPDGCDILVNSNKPSGTPREKVLKALKTENPDNPFGTTYFRKTYVDPETGEKKISALNTVNEEGDWANWSRTLASQELSKQSVGLAKQQLKIAQDLKMDQFNDIMSITNPTVRKQQLLSFADECDAAAVHLKAAAMPRQANAVILPFPNMKEDEIYAPRLENGDSVILIRHPHAGTFEIPRLTVNNNNAEAKKTMGSGSRDAVGINPQVAKQLSGADFDGDTVLVIPDNKGLWKNDKAIKELQEFEPKEAYANPPGTKAPWKKGSPAEGTAMGVVSNLITDMTLKGAPPEDLIPVIKHSMVVIDAGKHNLNVKQSEIDNNIAYYKKKYQGSARGGASTIVSRSKGREIVEKRAMGYDIDPETGEKIFRPAKDQKYTSRTGQTITKTQKSTKMYEAKEAYELLSDNPNDMEYAYADYANSMKALGNKARKEYIQTTDMVRNPSAAKAYATEVSSIKGKLNTALKNKPYEQQAQLIANKEVALQVQANPDIKDNYDEYKKLKGRSLTAARERIGAKKENITLSEKEWEAIQAGAISKTLLEEVLQNADSDNIKKLAMPKTERGISDAKLASAKSLINAGYTLSEVAQNLGVSVSTLERNL